MNEYVLVIINKWTDKRYVHPIIYNTLEEAEKEKVLQITRNCKIEIKLISDL